MHRYAETSKLFQAHSSLFPIMGITTTLANNTLRKERELPLLSSSTVCLLY